METLQNPTGVEPPASQELAYLTPAVVHEEIMRMTRHQIERIWQAHNIQSHWVPTIKYPPYFLDQVLEKAFPLMRKLSVTTAFVDWIGRCRKVWSVKSAAMFIVRITIARVLFDLVASDAIAPEVPPKEKQSVDKPQTIGVHAGKRPVVPHNLGLNDGRSRHTGGRTGGGEKDSNNSPVSG